jgi:zinc protease
MIKKEIQRLVQNKVSADELFDNQSNFIGRLPLQLESNEGVCGALTYLERYDLGLDYYQRFPSMVAEIKREQILDTAARFLDPDRLAIAGAGPALK